MRQTMGPQQRECKPIQVFLAIDTRAAENYAAES